MNHSEEVLHNVLMECLEKEIEAVPKDSEIKKQYTPSPHFIKYMKHLIRREKAKDKYKVVYEHRKGIYQFVAGAALIIISIQIGVSLISPNVKNESLVNDNISTESVPESADMATAQSADDSTAKSFIQETGEALEAQADIAMEVLWSASMTGENEAKFTLENTTNLTYMYSNIIKVEKLENDSWVTIYTNDQVEEKILNSGAFVEETIKLSDYEITEVGSYKLYRNVNNETITVEMELMQ